MSQGAIALLIIVLLSALFRNYVLAGAALLLLLLHGFELKPGLAVLQAQSFRVGIFFLMLYVLLPLVSDKFNIGEMSRGLLSPLGILAVLAGLGVSYLGGAGMGILAAKPVVLFGVIIGTLLAVLFLRGIPAGLIIAAGAVVLLGKIPLLLCFLGQPSTISGKHQGISRAGGQQVTSRIQLLDATLREGEQQRGIRFTGEQKAHLVGLLESFGVDLIEVGHPGISPEKEAICREAAAAARTSEVLMHARAVPAEVQAAHRARAGWVGIWASVNEVSLDAKFSGRKPAEIEDKVSGAVSEAKRLGLKVRFTVEDASRTPRDRFVQLARTALEAGADRISLADTVGVWEPVVCARSVAWAVEHLGCEIEVHLHNDLGLASANALAAVDAGATVVDASVLGIGERAGIADLLQLAVLLSEKREEHRFRLEMSAHLARTVEMMTGFHPDALRPVVGKNAFTHTGRYHTDAVRRRPETYEPFPPEQVGRVRDLLDSPTPPLPPADSLIVGKPFIKGSSELKYHRDGPGVRWVQMDSRVDPRTSLYVIQRSIGLHGIPFTPEEHVDRHTHHCDSLFIFWGDQADGSGLTCCVEFGDEKETVRSPASIFISAGVEHSYYYLSGRGTYTNIVLAPDYNSSLEESQGSS